MDRGRVLRRQDQTGLGDVVGAREVVDAGVRLGGQLLDVSKETTLDALVVHLERQGGGERKKGQLDKQTRRRGVERSD
jgi:hypothetical protein